MMLKMVGYPGKGDGVVITCPALGNPTEAVDQDGCWL